MGAALKREIQQDTSAKNWTTYTLAIFGGMGGNNCAIDREHRKVFIKPQARAAGVVRRGAAGGAD